MTYSITGDALNTVKTANFSPAWLDKLSHATRTRLFKTLDKRESGLGGLNNTQRREVAKAILDAHIKRNPDGTGTWIGGPNAGKLITAFELRHIDRRIDNELGREWAQDNREATLKWLNAQFVKLGGTSDKVFDYLRDTFTYARDSKGELIPNTSRTDFYKTGEYRGHLERKAAGLLGRDVAKAGLVALEKIEADRQFVRDLQIDPPPKENNTGNGANANGANANGDDVNGANGNDQDIVENNNNNSVNGSSTEAPTIDQIGDMNEVNRAEERKAATTPWIRGQGGNLGTRNDKTISFWNQKYKLDNVPKHDRDNLARALRTGEAWETGHGTILHTDDFGITHVYRQRG